MFVLIIEAVFFHKMSHFFAVISLLLVSSGLFVNGLQDESENISGNETIATVNDVKWNDSLPLDDATSSSSSTTMFSITSKGKINNLIVDSAKNIQQDVFYVSKGDRVCIVLNMDAKFSLQYKPKSKLPQPDSLSLPETLEIDGTCGNGAILPSITLKWKSYNLTITFNMTGDDKKLWQVEKFKLEYDPSAVFKDDKLDKSTTSVSHLADRFIGAPLNMSYSCGKSQTVALYDEKNAVSAYIVVDSVKMQAFKRDTKPTFGSEFYCGNRIVDDLPTPSEEMYMYRSDTLPIAVGSTLAIITIVVIAGYGIYRSFTVKKVDYDTMDE